MLHRRLTSCTFDFAKFPTIDFSEQHEYAIFHQSNNHRIKMRKNTHFHANKYVSYKYFSFQIVLEYIITYNMKSRETFHFQLVSLINMQSFREKENLDNNLV